MNTRLLVVAIVALSAAAVPTAAVALPGGGESPDWDGPEVALEPSDGPNGVYAVEQGDGELSIQIDGDNPNLAEDAGVNDGSVTAIPDIFTITNEGDQQATVWIETDIADVEFIRGTDSVQSLDGSANSVRLGTDESVHVGVRIHAVGDHDVERIDSFTVVAEPTDSDGGGETDLTPDPTDEDDPDDSSEGSLGGGLPAQSGDDSSGPTGDDSTDDSQEDISGPSGTDSSEASGDSGSDQSSEGGDDQASDSDGAGQSDGDEEGSQEDVQSPGSGGGEQDAGTDDEGTGGTDDEGNGGSTGGDGEASTDDGGGLSGVSTQEESDQTAPTLAGAVRSTLVLLALALLLGVVLFWAVRRGTDDEQNI